MWDERLVKMKNQIKFKQLAQSDKYKYFHFWRRPNSLFMTLASSKNQKHKFKFIL